MPVSCVVHRNKSRSTTFVPSRTCGATGGLPSPRGSNIWLRANARPWSFAELAMRQSTTESCISTQHTNTNRDTGEPDDWKQSSPVRRGADGKGPHVRDLAGGLLNFWLQQPRRRHHVRHGARGLLIPGGLRTTVDTWSAARRGVWATGVGEADRAQLGRAFSGLH